MVNSEGFARVAMLSDEPLVNELAHETLDQICERLRISTAAIHLTDGSAIMLKAEVNVPSVPRRLSVLDFGGEVPGLCPALQGIVMAEPGLKCELQCPASKILAAMGFTDRICVPLMLGSSSVGALSVWFELPRELTPPDLDYLIARSTRLALGVHHIVYFPDLGADWLNLIKYQAYYKGGKAASEATSSSRRDSANDGHVKEHAEEHGQIPLSRSLALSLPKGISLPTLRRARCYLESQGRVISRKNLAKALGVSAVTAGTYLRYFADIGVVDEQAVYGKVGRPALVYRLRSLPNSDDQNEETGTF